MVTDRLKDVQAGKNKSKMREEAEEAEDGI